MQQQTPPTVAAMLDGHGGAVTLTVLQKRSGRRGRTCTSG